VLGWLACGVAAAAAGFAVHTLARDWHDVRARSVHWTPGWLAVSVFAAAASQLVMAVAWANLVRALAGRTPTLPRSAGVRLWFAGQLGRFLPTGLGSLPARIAVCRATGISGSVAAASTAAELAAALALSGTAALLLAPAGVVVSAAATTAVVIAAALMAGWVGVRFTLLHVVKMGLRTVGVWTLLHMTGTASPSWHQLAGAIGLAYLAGLLAVFAPGGIGIREAVLSAALTRDGVGASLALGCVFGWRFVETGSEIALVSLTHTWRLARSLMARDPSPDSSAAPG
jgi:uncharacterized membrane protein YbhN (UPF0104 family)